MEKAEAEKEEKAAKDKRQGVVVLAVVVAVVDDPANVQRMTLNCNKSHASVEQLKGKRLERGVGLWDFYCDFWSGSIVYLQRGCLTASCKFAQASKGIEGRAEGSKSHQEGLQGGFRPRQERI